MIKRVFIKNFRSIGEEIELALDPLTALVGANGSGKSSIADALQFLADCFHHGLESAVTRRGGIAGLRRADAKSDDTISIRIEVETADWLGEWEISLQEEPRDRFKIVRERGRIKRLSEDQLGALPGGLIAIHPEKEGEDAPVALDVREMISAFLNQGFERDDTTIRDTTLGDVYRDVGPTDLAIQLPMILPAFEPLLRTLKTAVVYKIFPNILREPQRLDVSYPMRERGDNWASVLHRMNVEREGRDFVAALGHIVGDIDDYRTTAVGGYVIPEFRHRLGNGDVWLGAAQESDGTLRVAGILVALLQEPPPSLIGFEEPELTVHPGAVDVLFDHLREASGRSQILLTTHSSELLDLLYIDDVRVVERVNGQTRVSKVDEEQRALVKKRLATTSEIVWSEGLRSATGIAGNG